MLSCLMFSLRILYNCNCLLDHLVCKHLSVPFGVSVECLGVCAVKLSGELALRAASR